MTTLCPYWMTLLAGAFEMASMSYDPSISHDSDDPPPVLHDTMSYDPRSADTGLACWFTCGSLCSTCAWVGAVTVVVVGPWGVVVPAAAQP